MRDLDLPDLDMAYVVCSFGQLGTNHKNPCCLFKVTTRRFGRKFWLLERLPLEASKQSREVDKRASERSLHITYQITVVVQV